MIRAVPIGYGTCPAETCRDTSRVLFERRELENFARRDQAPETRRDVYRKCKVSAARDPRQNSSAWSERESHPGSTAQPAKVSIVTVGLCA